jgi:carbon monoxide dehydrogenase subunit G
MKPNRIVSLTGLSLLALLAVGWLFLPKYAHVKRSVVIQRLPEAVFSELNAPKKWKNWSPWVNQSPGVQTYYEGPNEGSGAVYTWVNHSTGAERGKVAITDSQAPVMVEVNLQVKGGNAWATYSLEKRDQGTVVTCSVDVVLGDNPLDRFRGLFMEQSLGPELQTGLDQLKRLLELGDVSVN